MSHNSWPEPAGERAETLTQFLNSLELYPARLALFDQALTHSSYAYEHDLPGDNERLEFLGDSLIGFIVAEWLYRRSPNASEGILSKQKGVVVSRMVLGHCAEELGLDGVLQLGRGDSRSSARKRSSVLGSALEALVGAAYLEMPFETVRDFVLRQIAIPSQEYIERAAVRDYKSALQELVQKRFHQTPVYRMVSAEGPDHEKQFCVEVLVNGQLQGRGAGKRRKSAENEAALEALRNLA